MEYQNCQTIIVTMQHSYQAFHHEFRDDTETKILMSLIMYLNSFHLPNARNKTDLVGLVDCKCSELENPETRMVVVFIIYMHAFLRKSGVRKQFRV